MKDLVRLVKAKPWLIPFLVNLPPEPFKPSDVAGLLGIKSDYVKHCANILWRAGLVKRTPEGKYLTKRGISEFVASEFKVVVRRGVYYADVGGAYAVIHVRKKYVRVRLVSKNLVREVLSHMRSGTTNVAEIALKIGQPLKEVSWAVRVLRAYKLIG